MERTTVWLGLKALIAFLEPPALEEGILEPYPVFLNFILDHISDDSPEFSHAVNCMRLLFEILGCKLWLRTSLPPSVMRDSLLSQCFHTQNEKSHKEIFDLFHPLLQSLEALHDGEFEKQRRHLVYFLLHQVTRSRNFSMLMRKKAFQIAFLIIHRGYKMNPPSPPVECAHMWGPSLVSSLKDLSLHASLRQPAIDLIQTIFISDATALFSSLFHCQTPTVGCGSSVELIEENDDSSFCTVGTEKNICHWDEFTAQGNIVSQEYSEWMCVPMLWLDVLADIEPSILPISVSMAVLWALSRFSMVEPENSSELSLPVKTWLSSSATELSAYFGWMFPTGSNDGGDGKLSKNAVRVSTSCTPLIKTFRRLAAHFVVRMEQGQLRTQWTWESQMAGTLILLLSDPNDNVRQVGRRILEHVSNTRGLTSGLQFLCCSGSSLAGLYPGLRHALKLVQLDSVLVSFQTLHHFFFVLHKIFKEGFTSTSHQPGNASEERNLKFAIEGGFLRQPTMDALHVNIAEEVPRVEKQMWEKFSADLAKVAWPSVQKCLHNGKAFIDYRICQMTCVRLLEILPVVFEKVSLLPDGVSGKFSNKMKNTLEYCWLNDLIAWGKSSVEAVIRYWKQSVTFLLALLKISCNEKSAAIITAVEKIISSNAIQMDALTDQVSSLSISLSTKDSFVEKSNLTSNSPSNGVVVRTRRSPLYAESSGRDDADVLILDSVAIANERNKHSPILLSDEEDESLTYLTDVTQDDRRPAEVSVLASSADKKILDDDTIKRNDSLPHSTSKASSEIPGKKITAKPAALSSVSCRAGVAKDALTSLSLSRGDDRGTREKELNSKSVSKEQSSSVNKVISKRSFAEPVKSKTCVIASKENISESTGTVLKELARHTEDPLELALKSAGRNHSSLRKQAYPLPKRKVIQLAGPVDSRSAYLRKLEASAKRFKPPNMDNWFRPILEMDYFATVGLTSPHEEENKIPFDLKKVPVSFESPQQYVNIFRPLVLEEFKAQLNSSFQELSSLGEMSHGSISVVSVERVDEFHLVRCVYDQRNYVESSSCMENDLILLTKQPLKDSPQNVHIVGKVEKREKDNKRRQNMLLIKFYLQSGYSRINQARKLLLERSKWFLSRIMSITPQLREFQALSSVEVIPALPIILKPSNHCRSSIERKVVNLGKLSKALQQVFESTYNESQIQAISDVVQTPVNSDDFGLSLVQGPPGTGKTRTVVALISALLAISSRSSAVEKPSGGSVKVSSNPFTNFRARISESAAIARSWQDAALARQLNNDSEKGKNVLKSSSRKRVLVCAQSNAAVDELVSRLAGEGLYGVDGNMYKPYLVRVGNARTIHPNSLPFFIDTLVEHRLAEEKITAGEGKNVGEESSAMLRESLEKIVDRIKFYESKRADLKDGGSDKSCALENEPMEDDNSKKLSNAGLDSRLRSLYQQKKEIYTRLSTIHAREKKTNEEIRALRNKVRRSILREAEIVATTLSGCGGDLYATCFESSPNCKGAGISEQNLFDAVVIDEAAQALEPATLIPLQLLKSSGTKCIMVGDPKQLPATVLSNVASRYLYECSMFERLQRADHPVIMLTKQYRMHPEISRFPSLHFYDGKLLNGGQLSSKTAPFHNTKALGPYVLYDVTDGQELFGKSSGSSSLYNEREAEAAVEIVRFLQKRYPSEFVGGRIGVITPYKAQLSLLRSRFSSAFGSSVSAEMEFNTVDGFQGREVDILILSTVRSSDTRPQASRTSSSSIGFVADVRRMNVALTRARLSLWIMGNANTLQRNNDWASLIKDAKDRNLLIPVKRPYKSVFEMMSCKSSNPRISGDYQEMICEKTERNQHIMQIEGNRVERSKGKHNYGGSKHSSDETSDIHHKTRATEYLQSANKKVDSTDRDKQLLEKQKMLDATHKSGKKVKKRKGSDLSDPRKNDIDKMSDARGPGDLANPMSLENYHKSQGKSTDETAQSSSGVDKVNDLISKRKQQREAVDALLSSSLIPSKISKASLKAVFPKRPLPAPSNRGDGLRPTKQQKGLKSETKVQKKEKSFSSLDPRRSK